MKRVYSSLNDFSDFIKDSEIKSKGHLTIKYGRKFALAITSSISKLLKTSKGRDKICAIIQYLSDFYMSCTKNSSIFEIRQLYDNNMILSAKVSNKIKDSMSQARKIFRFLNFVGVIRKIQNSAKSNKYWLFKILDILGHLSSLLYYIHDNILWAINIGILSDLIKEKNMFIWKKRKNIFSMLRIIVTVARLIIGSQFRKIKEKKHIEILKQSKQIITQKESDSYKSLKFILKIRYKNRIDFIEFLLCLFRSILLIKSLTRDKMELNRIFVSFCGLIASSISLFGLIFSKNDTLKIQTKSQKKKKDSSESNESGAILPKKIKTVGSKKKLASASSLIHTYS